MATSMDDKKLQAAFDEVRQDREEAKKFASDPEGYLQAKGIDTEGLKFGEVEGELADSELETAAGGAPTVCAVTGSGTGVTVCVSVGDDGTAY